MKIKTRFVCSECGYETAKWLGKCPDCGNWNTFQEETDEEPAQNPKKPAINADISDLTAVDFISADSDRRIKTGVGELDIVMGGGIVPSSLTLVGGEPGIGKSTLLLQICTALCAHGSVLYVSGEESPRQIKIRADRLGVHEKKLYILAETDIDRALAYAEKLKPAAVIVDSVQTMYTSELRSASGSVSQVREVTMRLMRFAKSGEACVFLEGHVTKDGAIAGPRVLEHMVDCVLYFEGDRRQSHRILRAVKNRFGSTNEIGVFEMSDAGLCEVENPSAALLSERPQDGQGTAAFCAIEGSRPILAEVQSLAAKTGFGMPRRMALGFDLGRLNLLLAVLEKRLGLKFWEHDVYVNIIGGLRLDEPAADLPVAAAAVSSLKGIDVPRDMLFLGEVGLGGELRSVSDIAKRVSESEKLGFKTIVLPSGNLKAAKAVSKSANLIGAKTLREALSEMIR